MKFSKHFFTYSLLVLFVFCASYSYYRFMVAHDYMVTYEGICDPTKYSCFIHCSDDTCTTKSYYDKVQKYAHHIHAQCGVDITNCSAANVCLPHHDEKCSITYCNPDISGSECGRVDESAPILSSTTIATSTVNNFSLYDL